jgi:hypothetical protein
MPGFAHAVIVSARFEALQDCRAAEGVIETVWVCRAEPSRFVVGPRPPVTPEVGVAALPPIGGLTVSASAAAAHDSIGRRRLHAVGPSVRSCRPNTQVGA